MKVGGRKEGVRTNICELLYEFGQSPGLVDLHTCSNAHKRAEQTPKALAMRRPAVHGHGLYTVSTQYLGSISRPLVQRVGKGTAQM